MRIGNDLTSSRNRAEFFNVISPDSRKLVRSCPCSATFGKAPREVYVDVKPVKGHGE